MTYTVDDKMKTLLAAPEAVAVLERFFPKILKNPALQMTAAMTLRQVAGSSAVGTPMTHFEKNRGHLMDNTLPPLKRIAAIHDLSGLGKCSLTVALPVISATGVECACIPTAVLSTHTGEFTGWTFRDLSDDMLPIARHWQREGVRIDGIYSGYLASPEQAELLAQTIDCIAAPDTLVIVDPVMADNGIYYSQIDERMCAAFRRLLSRADVITPNITEAALLAGLPYEPGTHSDAYLAQLFRALGALGAGVVTVTGVRPQPDVIGNVACDCCTGEMYASMRPAHPGLFYGTGDVFASALAGLLVRGAPLSDALETATALTDESICRSLWRDTPRHFGVDFEGALPAYIRRVEKIFEA